MSKRRKKMQPMQPQGAPQGPGENDPAYKQAVQLAQQVLYGNGAAKDVAKAMKTASNPVDGLAHTAYEMVTVIDERTGGKVPPEMLVSLAAFVLGEVGDIAEAAGIKVGGPEIAAAMQQMLLRYVTEQGLDPKHLQQAMAQVNPAQLGAAIEQHAGAQ
jgi:hypothetical protein